MSQSNRRSGSGGNRSGSQGTQGPRKGGSQGAPRSRSSTQGAARQPARGGGRQAQSQSQSSLKSNIDRALPPFTARRYVAIWLAGMVPLVFVLLLLTQCNTSSSNQSKYMIIETAKGRVTAKLHTEAEAGVSKTIANFEQKANSNYFDGRNFHRVESWVIQGGDPAGNGTGGGDMPSEYNQIPFKTGALGVARGPDRAKNNDSQFFIVKSDSDNLNGDYTNFGQVTDTDSMNVVNQIAIGDKINSIRVENR